MRRGYRKRRNGSEDSNEKFMKNSSQQIRQSLGARIWYDAGSFFTTNRIDIMSLNDKVEELSENALLRKNIEIMKSKNSKLL